MENKSLQVSEKIARIEKLTNDFSISKYNLLKISFLIRLIEETEEHYDSCVDCKANREKLTALIEDIDRLDDIEYRKPYEKEFNRIRTHFHKSHGFIPPYYYTARWSILGALTGFIMAASISFFLSGAISLDANLTGITFGMLTAYFISSIKELKYRKLKKII